MQALFYDRQNKSGYKENEISEYGEKRLGFAIVKGNSMIVQPISNFLFNIISKKESYIVDLYKRKCSCKIFQMEKINNSNQYI